MAEDRSCPQCNALLDYRLGEYSCPSCDYKSEAEVILDTTAGGKARNRTVSAQNYDPNAAAEKGFIHDYRRKHEASPEYDPSPSLNNEKLLLMGLFVVNAIINIAAAGSSPAATMTGANSMGAEASVQLGGLVFMLIVLFVPLIPIKWFCATCSCFIGMLGVAGLAMGLLAITFMGSPEGVLAWIAELMNVSVYLWLASVLYRDIQKLQL